MSSLSAPHRLGWFPPCLISTPWPRLETPSAAPISKKWVSAGFALTAESERTIVGFVVTVPGQFFGRDFVALLIVHPDHRRRGIGTALLDAAVSGAGTSRVFTSTNVSNKPMKALLSSTGWAYSGTVDGLDPGDPEEFYYIDR